MAVPPSPRVVFLPDSPVDREGDLFWALVRELGLGAAELEIDGDFDAADFIAFVGRRRAEEQLGRRVKSGRQAERLRGAETYVLPSTTPEKRGKFFEGIWREFASHVLQRDLAVRDEYKGMAPDAIRAALAPKRFPFSVCVANLVYDFNLGTIVRNANAFLASEVVIYGRKKTDLRSAMGSYVYETMVYLGDEGAFDRHVAEGKWTVVCFEQTEAAIPLPEFTWPDRPLMLFGQEGPGVPPELRARARATVVIPQHGSIRSLNAGVASGIAMYDWHRRRLRTV